MSDQPRQPYTPPTPPILVGSAAAATQVNTGGYYSDGITFYASSSG